MRDVLLGFLDLETGGLDEHKHAVVEVAAAKVTPAGEVLCTFERKVRARSGFTVEHEAWALHGMNGSCGGEPDETYRILRDFLEGTILAGHNVQYDARFLHQLQANGPSIRWLDHHVVDTAALLVPAWLRGEIGSCSLGKACAALGVKVHEPAHRALSDVLTTVELYRWIMKGRGREKAGGGPEIKFLLERWPAVSDPDDEDRALLLRRDAALEKIERGGRREKKP